ncbi:hypothetical protein SDC9_203267 [bioreactor metagenome]|uniref:Uncharacterized protein n=1 Tax=bioreactor metagenome TaxID=1076179 RepID=A0A645J7W5_9ZZZZ
MRPHHSGRGIAVVNDVDCFSLRYAGYRKSGYQHQQHTDRHALPHGMKRTCSLFSCGR